jgi:hypothetical protein
MLFVADSIAPMMAALAQLLEEASYDRIGEQ